MAIYFSQKDKKQFKLEDVKLFWEKIELSKVAHCVFGLSEVEMRLRKEQAKQALKDAIEQDKKEKKEAKVRLEQEQKDQKEKKKQHRQATRTHSKR
jgi:alpha-D-ribose 1-methylphosphonate 5-triphosphate synthase subunit PhnG